jgi:hypothetical protein
MPGRGKPFEKGKSGNPVGRPKSEIGAIIRERTGDGEELVERMLELMRKSGNEQTVQKSIEWLTDRGFGKAPQVLQHAGELTSRLIFLSEGVVISKADADA